MQKNEYRRIRQEKERRQNKKAILFNYVITSVKRRKRLCNYKKYIYTHVRIFNTKKESQWTQNITKRKRYNQVLLT
jgi:hypothetical protein